MSTAAGPVRSDSKYCLRPPSATRDAARGAAPPRSSGYCPPSPSASRARPRLPRARADHLTARAALTTHDSVEPGGSMTKADLVEEIAGETGVSKNHTAVIVDSLIDAVCRALSDGKHLEIRGFGT